MGDLSKNFSRWEFECKCGCGLSDPSPELVGVLQALRDWWRRPIVINSGHRCVNHNVKVGGAINSKHLDGTAADIAVTGVTAEDVQTWLLTRHKNKYGIGCYPFFTHIDVRPDRARWTG